MRMKLLFLTAALLAVANVPAFGQLVSLDHVDGLNAGNAIDIGVPVTLHIRITGDGSNHGGVANGFRVYSEDGATWGSLVGDTVGLGKTQFDGGFFISPFGITGSGADTVGFGGFRFFSTGLPAGYDDIAYTLALGGFDETDNGKTVCLDSSFYPPSGVWKWAGPDVFPAWSGPYCYPIGEVGDPPVIDCPGEIVSATACPGEQVCIALPITGADNVTVEGATWVDGLLCFDAIEPDKTIFEFHVVATNAAGETTCDVSVDVSIGVEPAITCPQAPMDYFLCNPGLVCVELVVDNSGDVTSSLGTWTSNTLCFNADTAGTYTIDVIAANDCGEDTCALVVNVTFGVMPTIACPDPITVETTGEPICADVAIVDADSVAVTTDNVDWTATWEADQLCFNSDVVGSFTATMIASNACGADTCAVLITIDEPPPPDNSPPVIAALEGFNVCADDTILILVSATDDDQDPISLSVEVLAENMTFYDSANGHGVLTFAPTLAQVGLYELTASASDGKVTATEAFTITVEDCTPPCVEMVLSATQFEFNMTTTDAVNPDPKTLSVFEGRGGVGFSFEIIPGSASWLIVDPLAGTAGESVAIKVNGLALNVGTYTVECAVVGDPEVVCEPNTQYFTVTLNVTIPPSDDDIVAIPTVPAVLGSRVTVPVNIEFLCDLAEVSMVLEYAGSDLVELDSVSFVGSLIEGWSNRNVTLTDFEIDLSAAASAGEDLIVSTSGLLMTLHFNVHGHAAPGFYSIVAVEPDPLFTYDCGQGPQQVLPTVINGGIVVGTSENYVCGYVVDPDGHSIEGATVELWPDFPYGAWDDQTFSDASGLFEFFNSTIIPFDVYAYKEGYYPGKVENINFAQTGIMIVLTPVGPITPTLEWVNFYCEENLYMNAPLPIGSVIDAYDPNGVHCGSWWVSEAGRYGFMPIYRDDPYTATVDEGAEPGDNIRLYVNGVQAYTPDPTEWTDNGDVHQVCLSVGDIIVKSCDLMEGWNLVSWNVDTESDEVADVLASIWPCLDAILGFEDEGLIYDPDLPMFSNLEYVDHLSGYWIKVDCDITLEVHGTAVPVTTGIPLINGWNLVSYLPDYNLPTEDALASIHDDLIVALGWGPAGTMVYQPGDILHNDLLELGPCNGYWTKNDRPGVLTYPGAGPGVAPQINRHYFAGKGLGDGVTATNTWMNLYSERLTLNGGIVKTGAVVTAHDEDGLMIGRFSLEKDGLFGFMAVYGDDKTTVETDGAIAGSSFALRIDGVQTNERFTFDGATGAMMEVGALTAKGSNDGALPNSYSLSQNYPNPFNPTTTISFNLPVSATAKIEIYNILGRLVAVPFDGMAQTGRNEVVWDGTNSSGQEVASGIYFYRLKTDAFTETKKMTLLK